MVKALSVIIGIRVNSRTKPVHCIHVGRAVRWPRTTRLHCLWRRRAAILVHPWLLRRSPLRQGVAPVSVSEFRAWAVASIFIVCGWVHGTKADAGALATQVLTDWALAHGQCGAIDDIFNAGYVNGIGKVLRTVTSDNELEWHCVPVH